VNGSPAERAGLRGVDPATGELGDVIVSADGKPVRRLADLSAILSAAGVGRTVRLGVLRDGRVVDVAIDVTDLREP
ncbi:MAG TPA: PDZ domain-containing protein, partial [Beijerinckiaceae bacterium]